MGFGGLGMWEIVLIFLVVLLLFGAKRLPEIGSSLGKGIREFKSSVKEIEREINTPSERESLSSGEQAGEPAPKRRAEETEPSSGTDERAEEASEDPPASETSRLRTEG